MRYVGIKIDEKSKNWSIYFLAIVVFLLGITSMLTGSLLSMFACTLIGGCYILWSGYLGSSAKKASESELNDETTIRYSVEKQYLVFECLDNDSDERLFKQ